MSNEHFSAGTGEKKGVNRLAYLSPLAVIALSYGYAVGWGSFVLPGTMFLPNAGPAGTIIGFFIGTVMGISPLVMMRTRSLRNWPGRLRASR